MIVDINKIIVRDRIRKDFGDIQELADDIMQNGLINPPVVNKDYELLAGERRLRACKSLGWTQIEVRMMDTRDAEHELNVEISENDVRKEFTKSERVDYMKRLLRIEQTKAKERMSDGGGSGESGRQKSDTPKRADESTASQFGVSRDTMKKEISIVENKDLLSAEDFANWDEGKLSTNKAFLKVKNRQKELEEENRKLREAVSHTGSENAILKKKLEDAPVKEIVKEVKVEVLPDDYEDLKAKASEADSWKSSYQKSVKEQQSAVAEVNELKSKIRDMENRPVEERTQFKLEDDSEYFAVRTYDFIKQNAGYIYIFDKINNLPEDKRQNFVKAIYALDAYVKQMVENLGGYGIE